jgi:type I restriction enzyme R subunit
MQSKTNEAALEMAIEKALTGFSSEALAASNLTEPLEQYRSGNGFYLGNPNDFNDKYAIDETRFWHFLESTQKEALDKLKRSGDWKLKILERYERLVKKYGILRLLRKGMEVDDAHFTLLYQVPMASSSQAVKDNFEKNEFSVSRQIRYNTEKQQEKIDMVIFVNGLPIATMELKNLWTGQTAKVHAIKQYKYDRDIRQPLLNFGRCIVHFAVDTDEVYMCTKLNGANSFFLPFNKGNKEGKGNPPNPFGISPPIFGRKFSQEKV